jgi:hypothetical protein
VSTVSSAPPLPLREVAHQHLLLRGELGPVPLPPEAPAPAAPARAAVVRPRRSLRPGAPSAGVQQAVVPRGWGHGVVRQRELGRPQRRDEALQHGVVVRRLVMVRGRRGRAEEEGRRTSRYTEAAAACAAVEAAVAPAGGALEGVGRGRHVLAAAVEGLAAHGRRVVAQALLVLGSPSGAGAGAASLVGH